MLITWGQVVKVQGEGKVFWIRSGIIRRATLGERTADYI